MKSIKIVDEFKEEYGFEIDWSEIYSFVESNCDILKNDGVKFDFNDPVIKRIVKNEIERGILLLNEGKTSNIIEFSYLNEFDDGREIIMELEELKGVLDCEVYRETLKKVFITSNEGRERFDVILMFKIMVLQNLFDYTDESIIKWIKTPPFKWFLDYPEEYPSESTFWKFKDDFSKLDIFDQIWEIHQKQLKDYGFGFGEEICEIAQDSKIITTDQGKIIVLLVEMKQKHVVAVMEQE